MGRRMQTSYPPKSPRPDKVPTVFNCLFCHRESCVRVDMDKKAGVGNLYCRICGQTFQSPIHYLCDPVDVYSDWVDACDRVAKQPAERMPPPAPPLTKESPKQSTKEIPALATLHSQIQLPEPPPRVPGRSNGTPPPRRYLNTGIFDDEGDRIGGESAIRHTQLPPVSTDRLSTQGISRRASFTRTLGEEYGRIGAVAAIQNIQLPLPSTGMLRGVTIPQLPSFTGISGEANPQPPLPGTGRLGGAAAPRRAPNTGIFDDNGERILMPPPPLPLPLVTGLTPGVPSPRRVPIAGILNEDDERILMPLVATPYLLTEGAFPMAAPRRAHNAGTVEEESDRNAMPPPPIPPFRVTGGTRGVAIRRRAPNAGIVDEEDDQTVSRATLRPSPPSSHSVSRTRGVRAPRRTSYAETWDDADYEDEDHDDDDDGEDPFEKLERLEEERIAKWRFKRRAVSKDMPAKSADKVVSDSSSVRLDASKRE